MDFATYVQLCGAMSPLGKVVLASDLSIAAAYFAIPIGLLLVWRGSSSSRWILPRTALRVAPLSFTAICEAE